MKSTGIVRPIDMLGRFVLPKEIRDTMDLKAKDPIEIYVDGGTVILKKYELSCVFCSNADNVIFYKGKLVCMECINELKGK